MLRLVRAPFLQCSRGALSTLKEKVLKNEQIKQETLRVVYVNPDTSKTEHKILSRMDAINFAKGFGLDLVLLNPGVDPPVCKLIDSEQKIVDDVKKKKLAKETSSRAKVLKEIFVSTGIDPHDLEVKVSKIKTFLRDGHQVRIGVLAKRKAVEKNASVLQQTVLRVVELTEDSVASITQPPGNSSMRRDLILTPKKVVVVVPASASPEAATDAKKK